jgi:hypothetical protein
MPIDCDDEYWYHPDPSQAFKQPQDKPSSLSYFISILKLSQILDSTLNTIVRLQSVLCHITAYILTMLVVLNRQSKDTPWTLWARLGTTHDS